MVRTPARAVAAITPSNPCRAPEASAAGARRFYRFGLAGRLALAGGFFVSAVTIGDAGIALLQLILAMIMLGLLEASVQTLRRAWTLLSWLIIPIVILHLLFTPGRLLFPGLAPGPSIEGVQAAAWLSLRLALLFFAAMVLLRSLSQREWLAVAARLPLLGRRLHMHLQLLGPMRQQLATLARSYGEAWRLRGQPLWAPGLLMGLLQQVLDLGHLNGAGIWLRWQGSPEPLCWGGYLHAIVGLVAAVLWCALAWQ